MQRSKLTVMAWRNKINGLKAWVREAVALDLVGRRPLTENDLKIIERRI
jgi:hypothetical protein